jgi:hypothetical protein
MQPKLRPQARTRVPARALAQAQTDTLRL